MITVLYAFLDTLEWMVVLFTFYTLLVPFGGFKREKTKTLSDPKSSFAIIIPAHNEEKVIGCLVESCSRLDYPTGLFDIYVIADNCSDGTVNAAGTKGAIVLKRKNLEKTGKGYALEYGFAEAFRRRAYDAVVVIDADNLVKDDFLKIMNTELLAGRKILQGRMDVKNPNDTWVTAVFAISVWVSNRFFYYAKHNFGLSAYLGGTGMCISSDVLEKIGWGATSLTEDLEFSVKALTYGIKTHWVHSAIVYDEKPLTFLQSWTQRLRWVRGQVTVAFRYLPKLLWRGLSRFDLVSLDGVLQLCIPFYVIAATITSIIFLTPLRQYAFDPFLGQILFSAYWEVVWLSQYAFISIVIPIVAVVWDGGSKHTLRYLLLFPFYQYSWVFLACLGFLTYREKKWVHTEHTRAITDLEWKGSLSPAIDLGDDLILAPETTDD